MIGYKDEKPTPTIKKMIDDFCSQIEENANIEAGLWQSNNNKFLYASL